MTLEKIISKNLRIIRQSKGLSQRKLADLSDLDVRQISKYENNPDHFSSKTLEKLTKGLGVKPHELLVDEGKVIEASLPKEMEPGIKGDIVNFSGRRHHAAATFTPS